MAHYARNQHQQHHRPQPLSLHPSSSHSHQKYPAPLHSAPLPSHTQYANMPSAQHRQQHGGGNAPLSAAYAQFQSSQLAYLQEMERNLVLQQQLQQQIMLQQQQVELEQQAERAMREMSIAATAASLGVAHHAPSPPSQQQRGYGGQGRQPYQQQQAPATQNQAPNPLVASALARRAKRQSFNGTDGQYAPHQQPQQTYSPAAQAPRFAQSQQHQRRATPPHLSPSHSPARSGFARGSSPSPVNSAHSSSSPTTRGPRRPSPPPPAVILSAPGEPYPDTSSSGSSSSRAASEDGGSDSGETRPSSPEREKEKEVKKERRRSHLDSLAMLGAAASARNANAGGNRNERRRPVSVNGPPASFAVGGVPSPRLPSTFARDAPPHAHAHAHPAHGKRTVSTPASTGALSASASSFAPLPNNSSTSAAPPLAHSTSSPAASTSAFGFSRQSAPPVPGTATATRQPKGPPTELGKSEEGVNFGQRIRQRAVRDLRGLALARGAGMGRVASPPQQVVAY